MPGKDLRVKERGGRMRDVFRLGIEQILIGSKRI